jgi:hypothetical protein
MPNDPLKRLETKIDQIGDKMSSIDITLAVLTESVVHHVKRTDILEAKIEPLDKHVAMVNGALKALGVIALILGLIEGFGKLLNK